MTQLEPQLSNLRTMLERRINSNYCNLFIWINQLIIILQCFFNNIFITILNIFLLVLFLFLLEENGINYLPRIQKNAEY